MTRFVASVRLAFGRGRAAAGSTTGARRRRRARRIWTLGLGLVAGCTGNPVCSALCSKADECIRNVNPQCNDVCSADPAFDALSSGLLDEVAGCVDTQPCSVLTDNAEYRACYDVALARVEPSDATDAFCEKARPRLFECGFRADPASCLEGFKGWADDVLGAAGDCWEETCEEYDDCLDSAFGP